MVCKPGEVCKNCAECFGCHAMKEPTVVGNCRPKILRKCPRERIVREARERKQRSSGGNSNNQNAGRNSSIQPISRIICGDSILYSVNGCFNMSIDGSGKSIRFSHCPALTFSSMQHAFEYFEAQARLQERNTIQSRRQQRPPAAQQVSQAEQLGLRAGQLTLVAGQQALLAKALDTCEPVWQFDAPLKPPSAKPVVRLPTQPYLGIRGPHRRSGAELVPQNTWEAPEPIRSSSRSSPPATPPQTLFAQSTPHAQEIQARPRVRLPLKELPTWRFQSQATKASPVQESLQSSNQAQAPSGLNNFRPAYPDSSYPPSLARNEETLDQPQTFYGSHSLPSSYSATALPQALAKKDRRILGVSLTADIDEIRAGFWLRDFQYNADRYQAASLEERAVAALKLRRAQEAVDRLCGCHE